jgi:hypothetical protein
MMNPTGDGNGFDVVDASGAARESADLEFLQQGG